MPAYPLLLAMCSHGKLFQPLANETSISLTNDLALHFQYLIVSNTTIHTHVQYLSTPFASICIILTNYPSFLSSSTVDYYDYIVVLDREVKDRLLRIAEATAHSSGAHLYEWERKIRLFCDFEGCITPRHHSTGRPLDVPSFGGSFQYDAVMDLIQDGCHSIARSLVTAGL